MSRAPFGIATLQLSIDLEAIVLDHAVGQQLAAHLVGAALRLLPVDAVESTARRTCPMRTSCASANPSACSECSIALPCGSSTPFFGVMKTASAHRSFVLMRVRTHDRGGALRDTLPRRHRGPAEAVLVELLASRRVPEAAGVRADLVAEQDLPRDGGRTPASCRPARCPLLSRNARRTSLIFSAMLVDASAAPPAVAMPSDGARATALIIGSSSASLL